MNTQQKQRFFASYWGQRVWKRIHANGEKVMLYINVDTLLAKRGNMQNDVLLLTHPSKITDAHCVELFDLVYPEMKSTSEREYKISNAKYLLKTFSLKHISEHEIIISFLRRNAYIFQFEGMSIEELVEQNVIELK